MKSRLALVSLAAVLTGSPIAATAQSANQTERIAASFVLTLGRAATAAEAGEWARLGPLPVADLIARHRQQIRDDAAVRQAVIVQACRDAFGRAPTDDETKAWSGGTAAASIYTEHVQRHLQWLTAHPADYEQVMHRAYQLLLRRDAYPEEIEYWKRQNTLSYVLLVGCIEDWARRNQPGLMVTAGTPTISVNSEFLTTVRLSPAIAAEARAAAGLASTESEEAARRSRHHLLAAGASQVATGGGIHFVAAGAN